MDKEEAKLILGCYRPNGRDASDPEMRQALELAEHDPELSIWFKREQEIDSVICQKVSECQVPESLKTSIIAGRKLVKINSRFKPPQLLAMAAVLIALIAVSVVIFPGDQNPGGSFIAQDGFLKFRSEMVQFVQSGFELDVQTGDTEELNQWFMQHSSPLIDSDAAQHLAQHAMGCKAFRWDGKPVSLMCYRVDEDQVLHLFVMDLQQQELGGLPQQDTKLLETVNQRSTASWQENGKAYLLVAHTPGIKVAPFL
ncbi:MAG: hypothetical protein AAF649_04245 [Verrucomicrobiota bacterium]